MSLVGSFMGMNGGSCVAVFALGSRGFPGASPVLVGAVALSVGALHLSLHLWVVLASSLRGLGPCLFGLVVHGFLA